MAQSPKRRFGGSFADALELGKRYRVGSAYFDGAVIITVIAVGVVQVSVDEVVDVVAVGHRSVAAVGAVNVVRDVTVAGVGGGAIGGIVSSNADRMFFDRAICFRVMQVPIVQVVDVVAVFDGEMTATVAVLVVVVLVGVVFAHVG